jgi:hypothetical protein
MMLKIFLLIYLLVPLSASAGRSEPHALLNSAPAAAIKVSVGRNTSWAEYCPDNTCDVIRFRRKVDKRWLATLAVAYFFYFSDYSYLRDWRNAENTTRADVLLNAGARSCGPAEGRGLARCLLLKARQAGLESLFIRYDEGKTIVQKVDLLEQLN